jgi:hypothetical protein
MPAEQRKNPAPMTTSELRLIAGSTVLDRAALRNSFAVICAL